MFCFEPFVLQGMNPEAALPPTDRERSEHSREGMENRSQKPAHTQSRKSRQAKLVEAAAHRDTSAISPPLESPQPGFQESSSISSGSLDGILLLSRMSTLKPMLNTNTTCTQTTEGGFLVTPSFTSQMPSKSFNCEVTKQRPFAVLFGSIFP